MLHQFVCLMAAHAETQRRIIWLLLRGLVCSPPPDLEAAVEQTLRPLADYEQRFTPFKNWPVIGWPLSIVDYGVGTFCRALLVPFFGVEGCWPKLNHPSRA